MQIHPKIDGTKSAVRYIQHGCNLISAYYAYYECENKMKMSFNLKFYLIHRRVAIEIARAVRKVFDAGKKSPSGRV